MYDKDIPYHRGTQCDAHRVTYDFKTRSGRLDIGNGGCCDMSGCISLFQQIDPAVASITTYSDGDIDTIYTRTAGKWSAR